jgi:hypothetical protein
MRRTIFLRPEYSPALTTNLNVYWAIIYIMNDSVKMKKMMSADLKQYVIDGREEADSYLNVLFNKEQYRSIAEVRSRAKIHIRDATIKKYFIAKAEEMLQNLR